MAVAVANATPSSVARRTEYPGNTHEEHNHDTSRGCVHNLMTNIRHRNQLKLIIADDATLAISSHCAKKKNN